MPIGVRAPRRFTGWERPPAGLPASEDIGGPNGYDRLLRQLDEVRLDRLYGVVLPPHENDVLGTVSDVDPIEDAWSYFTRHGFDGDGDPLLRYDPAALDRAAVNAKAGARHDPEHEPSGVGRGGSGGTFLSRQGITNPAQRSGPSPGADDIRLGPAGPEGDAVGLPVHHPGPPDTAERFGDSEPSLERVLVEAGTEIGAAEPAIAYALA